MFTDAVEIDTQLDYDALTTRAENMGIAMYGVLLGPQADWRFELRCARDPMRNSGADRTLHSFRPTPRSL